MLNCLSESNSIVSTLLAQLRDCQQQKQRQLFRSNIEKLGLILGYELSKTLSYSRTKVQTSLGVADQAIITVQPVIASILRAGLPLHSGMLQAFPEADNCFIGAYRKHAADGSFTIQLDYLATPDLTGRTLIVTDPMLATGASLIKTLSALFEKNEPQRLELVSILASKAGVDKVQAVFPHANIWVAAIDQELNAQGFIVPGLGDAGDLSFGECMPR